jgi:uncharacterized protein (TIGR03066 family)
MRAILGCGLAVVMAVVAVAAADAADEKIDAKKLVGKWQPKEEKKDAKVVIEFTKDGKALYTATADGKDFKIEGTYKLDGNKLALTMKFGDKEDTKTRTISKLTDTELTSKDEKGKEDTLVRIK